MVTLDANMVRLRARTLDPVKVLVTLIGVLPFLLGYLCRFVWFALSVLIAAGMEGWDNAGRRVVRPVDGQRGG